MAEESHRVEEEVREGEVVEAKFSKKEKARGRGKSKTKDPTLPPITDVRATEAEPSSGIDMSEERILGVEAFLGQQEQRLEAVESNLNNLESTTFDGLGDIKETVTKLAEEHREGIRALTVEHKEGITALERRLMEALSSLREEFEAKLEAHKRDLKAVAESLKDYRSESTKGKDKAMSASAKAETGDRNRSKASISKPNRSSTSDFRKSYLDKKKMAPS
ncbi:hypothetical protein HAX54_025983 [Datura stramonium]|uniref:Uncharacterized protein n=1 Tax=Datura stramonium TaxID=4076 RepID=A0ABS8V236_DATST|nr:hypothetical protein [Datura stramonium]